VREPEVFIDGEKVSAEFFSVGENNPGEPAQPATREHEVRALTVAMRSLGLDHGLILTEGNAAPITENGLTIEVRSLAEWLLQPSPVS
jgi:hypothetical protein